MQRKAILSKRVKLRKVSKRVCIIGVFGLHSGAGVTHFVLLLAHYIGNICGRDVAVKEISGRDDFEGLKGVFKVKQSSENQNQFICRNITFVLSETHESFENIRSKEYEYYILDFGCNYRRAMKRLMECDLKLVLYNNAPWHQDSLEQLNDMLRNIHDDKTWCLIRNLANTYGNTKRTFSLNHYSVGFEPKHFYISKITKNTLKKVLHTVL